MESRDGGRKIKFRGLSEHGWKIIDLTGSTGWSRELLGLLGKDEMAFQFKTTLEQFTGLKDKNGKDIYEGDIVKVYTYIDEDEPKLNDFTIHKVYWGDDYPAFDLEPDLDCEMNGLSFVMASPEGEKIEVIGNIHENPELLNPPPPEENKP